MVRDHVVSRNGSKKLLRDFILCQTGWPEGLAKKLNQWYGTLIF